jgi:hypothetical protein
MTSAPRNGVGEVNGRKRGARRILRNVCFDRRTGRVSTCAGKRRFRLSVANFFGR